MNLHTSFNDDTSTMIPRLPLNSEIYQFENWTISYEKSHILKSICTNKNACVLDDPNKCCELCLYGKTLDLPHLPDMVFSKNILRVKHANGAHIEFNAMDALKCVESSKMDLKVACSEEWRESRPAQLTEPKLKPFDWTFTSDYEGTLSNEHWLCEECNELKIDKFKLMRREKILFYHDITLYEDELHDHGIASCSVKIRVMPSGFYILLRFFVRVDSVMIRINDTRYHYEIENDFILKEYTSRESKVDDLLGRKIPPAIFTDPNLIEQYLPVTVKRCVKLIYSKNNDQCEN